MCEQEHRLIRCFASVFPGLTAEEIRASSAQSTGDSLSLVTLAAVIQEEFGVDIDPEVLSNLDSFTAFWTYLRHLERPGQEGGDA